MLFARKKYGYSKARLLRSGLLVLSNIMLAGGVYIILLSLSPQIDFVPTPYRLNDSDDILDKRNRVQIEKIGLEVPYQSGGLEALNKGVWWRHADRGNPKDGGNFILSAHRFYIGLTPKGTKARSPFYKLEDVQVGDKIRVFYEGDWYGYDVVKKYTVKPDAVEIEAPSTEAKMTLYTCTLGGTYDGRVVLEAHQL